MDIAKLPRGIFSGNIPQCGHVQGIATDGEFMYFSFTTKLIKTDLAGNLVGSVTGLTGHLGCIAYSDTDRCIYGSLEYKNDSIGMGILKGLGRQDSNPDAFYIARFETERICETGMDAMTHGIMTMVKLADAVEDYTCTTGANPHRYGCSGIDGITIMPDYNGARTIFVAYGIYGDVKRDDNDNQVLLRFDFDRINGKFAPIRPDDKGDGIRAEEKLFVYTGNTSYGIQNLEYDPYTGCLLAAVYRGQKPQFPNRAMYFIDPAKTVTLPDGRTGFGLAERGLPHPSGIWGSDFSLGSTGLIALGGGYYYFSQNGTTENREQFSRVSLYRLEGTGDFVKA
ncbi:MAG: hypothetical protein E7632_04840 [Ruminococcaceae bacterium]|nr:hypothetical protein [Oscillospiraceae bacterium]